MAIEKPIRYLTDRARVGQFQYMTKNKCFRNINPLYCQDKKKKF